MVVRNQMVHGVGMMLPLLQHMRETVVETLWEMCKKGVGKLLQRCRTCVENVERLWKIGGTLVETCVEQRLELCGNVVEQLRKMNGNVVEKLWNNCGKVVEN